MHTPAVFSHLLRCIHSAIYPFLNPRKEMAHSPSYLPKQIAIRRMGSYGKEEICNGKKSITADRAVDLLSDCFPIGVRLATGTVKRSCRLHYWCPYCWVRTRTIPTFKKVFEYLLNENGNPLPGREDLSICVIKRAHDPFAVDLPLIVTHRLNNEFNYWSWFFNQSMDQYKHFNWLGSIKCDSFKVQIAKGLSTRLRDEQVYRITPVTSSLVILPRSEVDDLIKLVSVRDSMHVTRTSAAMVVDPASLAQQVAIATRIPKSWYRRYSWDVLPDANKALAGRRLYATYGCLRKDTHDQQDAPRRPVTPVVADKKAPLRVSVSGPDHRFSAQSNAARQADYRRTQLERSQEEE